MFNVNPTDGTDIAVDQLTRIESKVDALLRHLGLSVQNVQNDPGGVESPPPPSVPSGRGKRSLDERYALLRVVFERLFLIPEMLGNINPISGTQMPRIYFKDSSFLYFNEYGKLYSGIKVGDRTTCEAQNAINTYLSAGK